MNPFETARALLFPPRCISCGKRIGVQEALCESCMLGFERAMRVQCHRCNLEYASCRCVPAVLRRAGAKDLIKLLAYTERADGKVAQRIVLGMKKKPHKRAVRFCAEELAASLRPILRERAEREADRASVPTVVTWLPRNRRNRREYGFDQAEALARAVAEQLALPALPLLVRCRDALPQKELSAAARMENLRGVFASCADVRGMRVLLVDDVVTTGAGLAHGTRVLRRSGAHEVLPVALAATELRRVHK